MSVTIHCPHCGATGNAPDHILGQSVRCSKCKKQFVAGGEEEEEVPEEEPADSFDDMDEDSPAPPPKRGRGAKARSGGGGGGGGSWFGDFASFRLLIAPKTLVILYWVVVAFIILIGLGATALSFMGGVVAGLGTLVGMLIFIPLQCIMAHVGFELMLVQFRIYETLKELKEPE